MKKNNEKRLEIKITEELKNDLVNLCQKTGRNMSDILREAIIKIIKENNEQ